MNKLGAFVLYKDWSLSILNMMDNGELSCEEVGDLFIAISEYQLNGVVLDDISDKTRKLLIPLVEQFKKDEAKFLKRKVKH